MKRRLETMWDEQAGFTIPELVITIVFIGFAFLGITSLYLTSQRIQENTSWLQSATHAGETEIESLRNNDYGSLTTGQDIDFSADLPTILPAPRSGTVVVSEPLSGLKRVDVTVTYTDHGTTRTVQLSSLIGVIGISQ
jgi:type II secretory pathway pseudopilin PulG